MGVNKELGNQRGKVVKRTFTSFLLSGGEKKISRLRVQRVAPVFKVEAGDEGKIRAKPGDKKAEISPTIDSKNSEKGGPPYDGNPPIGFEASEFPGPREVARHLLSVERTVDMMDPRIGAIHGTSMEVVKQIIERGFLRGHYSASRIPGYEVGEVSVFPTPKLCESSEIMDLLDLRGERRVTEHPEKSREDAIGYAEIASQYHCFLTMLDMPFSERYNPNVSAALDVDPSESFPYFLEKGISKEDFRAAAVLSRYRKGFLLGFNPQILYESGITFHQGDAGEHDILIKTSGNGLPYHLISAIEPLCKEERTFLQELRY